jgi:GNAT superfamily N-acetyltransferase
LSHTSLTSPVSLSDLDSQRFGVITAKTNLECLDDLKATENFVIENSVELTIARVSSTNIAVVHAAMNAGFILMDTLAFYTYDLLNNHHIINRASPDVRLATRSDAIMVKEIAGRAFHAYDAHYHADSRLDQRICDEVYADWAYRSCLLKSVADVVLLYEIDGKIAGFATVKLSPLNQLAEGPLFAVDLPFRGQGVFKNLLQNALLWAKGKECSSFVYSTQITNIAVLRTLCREGFIPLRYVYTFHRWNGK